MKSFNDHLKSTRSFGENIPLNYKPTMRSSAIFPIRHIPNKFETIITFLGYWLLKRKIKSVTAVITLRDRDGTKVEMKSFLINEIRSYVFKSSDFLKEKKIKSFIGSFEIEIFSSIDMVFPYPAITLAYQSSLGKTFVHTAGRIYNNLDDLNDNEFQLVPETGFDIFLADKYSAFFSFVNGPVPIKNKYFIIQIIDINGNKKKFLRKIKYLKPYGVFWNTIFKNRNEKKSFSGEKVTAKIIHKFKGFFPRFIAGNIYKNNKAISLTHTYYDTSKDTDPSSIYKNPNIKSYYDSVITVPIDEKFDLIEIAIYPNMKKIRSKLHFEFYDCFGNLKYKFKNKILISNNNSLRYIDLIELLKKNNVELSQGICKIILDGNGYVPTRMKFGLNFKKEKKGTNLPSNICFNASVPNKKIIFKPSSFRWCTIFSVDYQNIYIFNSSFIKNYSQSTFIKARVMRQSDNNFISFSFKIQPNGMVDIIKNYKKKIKKFLKNEIGWITFVCDKPFTNGFYVTDYDKGVIGADHLY